MPQIEKRFNLNSPRSYQLMKRLAKGGFVNHERIFYGVPGVFSVTRGGAEFTDLPAIKEVSKESYKHQLAIIDTYLKLRNEYPDAEWVSERQVRREHFYKGLSKSTHISDGILVMPDERQIAIEVELTVKSRKRLQKILWGYATHKTFDEVWYFCTSEVGRKLTRLAAGYERVKIYNLT